MPDQSNADREPTPEDDLLYTAWTIIANAYEGDWEAATPEWRDAAERWRDRWHEHIDAATGTELECFIAGVISTFSPYDREHPAHAVPIARAVLAAIGEWEPADA